MGTRTGVARHRVAVLMYHAIEKQPSIISISPITFARQMRALHDGGYRVIALRELVRRLLDEEPLPPRSVVLTFDDGFASVYTAAFPSLARYGFPATVFAVSGYCGKDNGWPSQPTGVPILPLMTWEQVRELDRHGIEIGSHTLTHPRLDQFPARRVEEELTRSKRDLEDHLGRAVDLFAYPSPGADVDDPRRLLTMMRSGRGQGRALSA